MESSNAASSAPESAALSESSENLSESQSLESGQSLESQEASIDANPNLSKAEKAAAKKTLKSLRIKVDGREFDEELPFELPDDEESVEWMKRNLQMSRMGQKRSQELSSLEKEVRTFIEELKKNPRKVLADPTIGIDVKRLAAEVIEEEIENSQKSPEQLEKERLERELRDLKEQREREKEEQNQREFERIQQESFERYDMLIGQALEKSDLPKSPYVVKKMADYMLLGLQNNIELSPSDVLPIIREEIQEELKDMFAVMPEEVIEAIIGQDVFTRVRKKNIAKAKQAKAPPTAQNVAADTGKTSKADAAVPAQKQSIKDF
ncbi:hypothetical protein EBS02_06960, partial [bacterium]|nr:hypothetical protein [bacterium]